MAAFYFSGDSMEYDYRRVEEEIFEYFKDDKIYKPYNDCLKKSVYLAYSPNISNLAFLDIYARFLRMQGNNVLFPLLKSYEKGISTYMDREILDSRGVAFERLVKEGIIFHNHERWFINISSYFDKIKDFDLLDLKPFKKYMEEEIGATIRFDVLDYSDCLEIFMSNPDMIYGVTYIILDKHNEKALSFVSSDEKDDVITFIENDYIDGFVFTGSYAIHPLNKRLLPIFIGREVDHGAIAAVPAHDEEQYVFAKRYELDIIPVVDFDVSQNPCLEESNRINSDFLDGMNKEEALQKIIDYLEENEIGIKESFFGKNLILIGEDNKDGYEIAINHVIYHIKLYDSLNSLAHVFYLATYEGNIQFDEYAKKDFSKYLPADFYAFDSFDDYLVAFILSDLLFKDGLTETPMLSMNAIYLKNKESLNSMDLDHLVVSGLTTEEGMSFLDELWTIFHLELVEDAFEIDDLFISTLHKISAFIKALKFKEALSSIKELMDNILRLRLISQSQGIILLKMVSVFTPFIAEEINKTVYNSDEMLCNMLWPEE